MARRFVDFWWGTGLADDVPALTYYLVLSLAPFALGAAALQGLLLESVVSALAVAAEINRYLPEEVHGDVERLVTGTRSSSPWLLLLALAAMLWTSSGAIGVIERCTSRILDCPRHGIVWGRIRNMALGLLVAFLVLAAAASGSVVAGLGGVLGTSAVLPDWLLVGANAVGAMLLFAVLYRSAPKGHLHWRSALIGGAPAGIALQVIPTVVGLYVKAAAGYQVVRLFLVLAIILLGLYAMATVVLVGAGIAAQAEQKLIARRP